jgi:hypothetical protein
MQQRVQQWEADAAKGFTEGANTGSSVGIDSDVADTGYAGADAGSSSAASSNPFAALAPEWQQGADESSTFLAELQGQQSQGAGDISTASSQPLPIGSTFGEWLMLDGMGSAAAAAPGANAAQEQGLESGDDGWEVASMSSSTAAGDGLEEPVSSSVAASPGSAVASLSDTQTQCGQSSSSSPSSQQHQQHASPSRELAAAPAVVGADPEEAVPPLEVRELETLDRPIEELLLLEDIQGMNR